MRFDKAYTNGACWASTRRRISLFLVLALLVPHGEVRRRASAYSRGARTRAVCQQLCFSMLLCSAMTRAHRAARTTAPAKALIIECGVCE